jgi:predicted SprT family Zn-dependent metalloprotease
MLAKAQRNATGWWNYAICIFGDRIGKMPIIVMNNRLTSTAGRAWLDSNKIDLSVYLMAHNEEYFYKVIIPHELCHHIAYRLMGDTKHGKHWKETMVKMGLTPDVYHPLITLNQRKKAGLC